jgi:Fur family ferric uptake transcriptional regulator
MPTLQKRIDDQPSISREMIREAQQILHQHLKRVGLKHTAQRDTILRTFLETREHLSTNELHRLVHKKDSRIGFTTVYRTLKVLADCGLASVVAFHDGIARYEHQYNRRSHHHMVCTECGSSVEFFSPEVGELEQEIGRKHNYQTTRHTFQIRNLRRLPQEEQRPAVGLIVMTTSCPQCGTQVPSEIAFCTKCGLRLFVGIADEGTRPRFQDNLLGAIAYFTFIPAIILLVVEPFKRNHYIRFHALQSAYLAIAGVIFGLLLRLVVGVLFLVPWVGFFLAWLLTVISALAVFMVWLVLVVKALLGERFQAPLIGGLAENGASR